MDDDDGEDVVLVDSPLYVHMKELGFDEFEMAEKCDNLSIEDSVSQASPAKTLDKNGLFFKVFFNKLCNSVSQGIFNLNMETSKEIRNLITESQLLQESDHALLEDLFEEVSDAEAQNLNSSFFTISRLFFSNFTNTAIAAIYLSYLVTFLMYLEYSLWNCIFLIVLSLYTLAVVILWTFLNVWKRNSQKVIRSTSELLKSAYSLHDFFKKGIRMIQEAELIARGFTLVSVQATAQRLESSMSLPVRSPEKQCPELRESVFQFARKCFLCYRNATYQLLKIFPLHKDIDMSSHYLACIKLDDLGPLFMGVDTDEAESSSENLSEFFSVSSLKAVVQLMELQQSEFFRRFGLSFLHGSVSDSNHIQISRAFQTYSEMKSILCSVLEPVSNAISGLHRIQLYYKHLGINKSEVDSFPARENRSHNRVSGFQTAVHSLLLHLQASIIRVQDLENDVLALSSNEDFSTEESHNFQKMLAEIQCELDASSTCLEESLLRLTSQLKLGEPKDIAVPSTEPEIKKKPIPLFELGEPVVEDQVFEAFTTNLEDGSNNDSSTGSWLIDDRETRKKSKECSANLLRELKSVLINKAEEHRVREAIAKAKLEGCEDALGLMPRPESDNTSSIEGCSSSMLDSLEKSEETIVQKAPESSDGISQVCKSDSDSTGSIEILNVDSPLEEKFIDFLEAEHDSASTGSIEVCGDSPLVEYAADFQAALGCSGFNLAAAVAAQVAQRSRLLGLAQQTFTHEPEESFGDSDTESPS